MSSSPRLARLLVLGLIGTASPGCTSDDGFDLRVDLRTDYRPVYRFQSVRVRILEAPTDEDLRRSAESPASVDGDYLTGVRVGSFSSLPQGRYLLDVALMNGGTPIATREIEIDLSSNTTVNAVMTASCAGLTCPGAGDPSFATECVSGRCVAPDCTPETPEACPPLPPCVADSECPAIGDCLSGLCIFGDCFQSPDDSACTEGSFCDETGSCEPIPMMTDMGPGARDLGPPPLDFGQPDGGPPRPTIAFETPQPGGCIDLGQDYTGAGEFTYRRTITGPPRGTATQYNDHVSCGDPEVSGGSFALNASGFFQDTFQSAPLPACWDIIYGRWDVTAEVGGVRSAPTTVTYYNSDCPNVNTCAEASTFCSPCRFCDGTEYCYSGLRCEPTPELTIETSNGPGCVDLGVDHSDPPAINVIITGRRNATATQYNQQVSCSGSARVSAETRNLGSTGRVEDPLLTGAVSDCGSSIYGRWAVEQEVDGEVSNTVEVVYYNSACSGIATCTQARTFCP